MDLEEYFANATTSASSDAASSPSTRPRQQQYSSETRMTNDISPLSTDKSIDSAPRNNNSSSSDWASMSSTEDWEDWSGTPAIADLDDIIEVAELREKIIERRRARQGRRKIVRDEYLRPIVDATGIYNRLAISEKEAEERVFIEAITNQYESREALRHGVKLIAIPVVIGFVVSRIIAQPLWSFAESMDERAFALSDEQKVEGAEAMHREEVRLRMEASLGQAPELTDEAMLEHLKIEAKSFADEMKAYNKQALLNVVSDSTSATTLFVLLLRDTSQRAILFRTIGRVFTGLSGKK